jgi:hypothetical protein
MQDSGRSLRRRERAERGVLPKIKKKEVRERERVSRELEGQYAPLLDGAQEQHGHENCLGRKNKKKEKKKKKKKKKNRARRLLEGKLYQKFEEHATFILDLIILRAVSGYFFF